MLKNNYRSALVTGASSGLGRGLAKKIAALGIPVVLVARRVDALQSLASEIQSNGGKAWVFQCDVGNRAEANRAIAYAVDQMGSLDLLICNAGVSIPTPLRVLAAETIEEIIRVNVLGTTHFVSAAMPHMLREQRGHVVAVSSLAAFGAFPQNGAYCASKAAINTFMKSLHAETRSLGIHTTTICPGFIQTAMTAKNKFPMPFLMSEERAVDRMWQGIAARQRFFSFPWQTRVIASILNRVPQSLLWRIMQGSSKRKKSELLKT